MTQMLLPVTRADLVADQGICRFGIGNAQKRLCQAHEDDALAARQVELMQQRIKTGGLRAIAPDRFNKCCGTRIDALERLRRQLGFLDQSAHRLAFIRSVDATYRQPGRTSLRKRNGKDKGGHRLGPMLRREESAGQQILMAERRLTIGRLLEQFQTVIAYGLGAKEGCMTYGTLPPGGYPSSSKWFHWLVAISVIIQAPLGIILVYAELGAWQDRLYNFHKSLGVLILILMILRVLNRLIVGAPAAEPTIARWQHSVSSAVHGALYVLLILQALVGYWANSAFGASTPFFGLFEIPAIGGKNDALSNTLFMLHRWIGIALVILVGIHVAAALQHYFIQRDGVLQRMLPQALGGR